MLSRLPGWVVDDVTSVREEVRELVSTTPAARWRLAVLCSRDAMWAIQASGMRERILAQVDPVPESTNRALERLRRAAGWGSASR